MARCPLRAPMRRYRMRIARLPPTSLATPAWPPLLASQGAGARSSLHAHHAMHFVVAADGEIEVRAGTSTTAVPGVLTAPDTSHAVDARDREILLVFIDPESDAGAALAAAFDGPIRALDAVTRSALYTRDALALMQGEGDAWIRKAVARLGVATPAPRPPLHPRVRRVLRHLRALPPGADTSLPALAEVAQLSPGRLMHTFTASIGIPLRPYLAWLRLQRAAGEITRGTPLSMAAASSGFSDAAHMSRTFRRMLGMAPSMLQPARSQPVRS
jgi:AraC-like DNA-binding protein